MSDEKFNNPRAPYDTVVEANRRAQREVAESLGLELKEEAKTRPDAIGDRLVEIEAAAAYCLRRGMTAMKHSACSPRDVIQLVAIARAALALDDLECDLPGCSGWHHTMACQGRRTKADRAIGAALRGTP